MLTKAQETTRYIVKTVAPLFNQKGYAATSMSDITKATGLTKGAIYGNFKSKEDLALSAFKLNVSTLLGKVAEHQEASDSPLGKLYLITDFYKNYYMLSSQLGGCPILNIGVDAKHQNSDLLSQVARVIQKTQAHIEKLVLQAQEEELLDSQIDPRKFAKNMYSSIQGAIFMMQTMQDQSYMYDATQRLEKELKQHEI